MANKYYEYKQRNTAAGEYSDTRSISLWAVDDNNQIELAVGYTDERCNVATTITLNEQEQDDLIAGILERRGRVYRTTHALTAIPVSPGEHHALLQDEKLIKALLHKGLMNLPIYKEAKRLIAEGKFNRYEGGISATSNQQSQVHPADDEEDIKMPKSDYCQ